MADIANELLSVDTELRDIDSLLQRVRADLASWMDRQLGDIGRVLSDARATLSTYVDTGLGAVQSTRRDLQQRMLDFANRILADGLTTLQDYGIEIPPIDQLTARQVGLLPGGQRPRPGAERPAPTTRPPPTKPTVQPIPSECSRYPQCSDRWVACLASHGLTPEDVGITCVSGVAEPAAPEVAAAPVVAEPAPARPPPVVAGQPQPVAAVPAPAAIVSPGPAAAPVIPAPPAAGVSAPATAPQPVVITGAIPAPLTPAAPSLQIRPEEQLPPGASWVDLTGTPLSAGYTILGPVESIDPNTLPAGAILAEQWDGAQYVSGAFWAAPVSGVTSEPGTISPAAQPAATQPAFCPVPQPPACPTPQQSATTQASFTFGDFAAPYWGTLDICDKLDVGLASVAATDTHANLQSVGLLDDDDSLAWLKIDLDSVSWWDPVTKGLGSLWNTLVASGGGKVIAEASKLFDGVFAGGKCPVAPMIVPFLARALLHLFSRLVGPATGDLAAIYDYQANYYCPTLIPTKAEADLAYLRDMIDDKLWRCWARANNWHEEPARVIRDSQREMPTPLEFLQGWLRGLVPEEEIDAKLRKSGMTDESERKLRKDLAYIIPPVTDLPRFMIRDVMDPEVVGTAGADGYPVTGFGLDAEFEAKFQGQLKEWAKGQGVSDDVMRAYWRAHWVFPSPTQLYEMLHRLRPDNVPAGTDPTRWVTTADTVRHALGVNDILPYWRDRLMAVSYNPLTRVDARRAYNLGLLTRDQMLGVMQDIGYSPVDAERLTAFADVQRMDSLDARREVKSYEKGTLSRDTTIFRLTKRGFSPEEIDTALSRADLRRQEATRAKCNEAMHRRYLLGEFSVNEAITSLIGMGVDGDVATTLVNGWECERAARGKELSTSLMCRLIDRGLITVEDMRTRLQRVGYDPHEAELIIADCLAGISERRLAAQQKAAAKAASDLKRRQKEEAAAAEKQAAALARAIKDQQAAADKARREQERLASQAATAQRRELSEAQKAALGAARQKQAEQRLAAKLADAAGDLATRLGVSILSAEEMLESAIGAAATTYGLTRDAAAAYALTAMGLIPEEGDVDLNALVADAVAAGESGESFAAGNHESAE